MNGERRCDKTAIKLFIEVRTHPDQVHTKLVILIFLVGVHTVLRGTVGKCILLATMSWGLQ